MLGATNTGIEGVFASKHFDVSLLGFNTDDSANITRRAHDAPIPYLVHASFKATFKNNKIKASIAYQNQYNLAALPAFSSQMTLNDRVTTGDLFLAHNNVDIQASLFRLHAVKEIYVWCQG